MAGNILFITSAMCKGGAETQLVKLALFLKSLNFNILIISLKPINEFTIDYEKAGIPVVFLKSWRLNPVNNCCQLYDLTKAFKPDLVIAFMFISIIFARLLKKVLPFKLISTIRIGVIPGKWYVPFKLTSGLDDLVVYNSQASKINFESKRIVKSRGIVIRNAIQLPKLGDKFLKSFPNGKFIWICIAHFRWNKDYTTLFKAISKLKGRNFRVDIIGEYDKQNNPFRLINQLEIQDHVNLLGFKQNAADYLKYADAFVLSSHSEGMPNALLEAMAYSKPVVVTNIECNAEVVQNSGCGLLSKLENEQDLAEQMLIMMKMTPEERSGLGTKGRLYIQNNFAEDDIMKDWLRIVNQYIPAHQQVMETV